MTGWFDPKLEPGERVLLRDPAWLGFYGVALLATSVIAVATLYLLSGRFRGEPISDLSGMWLFLGGTAGLTAGLMALLQAVRDRWAITDRRVVARRGALRRTVEAVRRERVDRTALDGDDLLVHGEGRTMRLDLSGVRDAALQAALGGKAPPAGHKAAALGRIMEQGESLVWRHAALCNLRFPGAPWSAAVTERRVLLRRLHDRTRYDDIPLAAIAEIEAPHEGSHRVYIHANGQRYEFRPRSLPAAERMYAAIARAKAAT